jgi:flagellar hook-length control protein FliK
VDVLAEDGDDTSPAAASSTRSGSARSRVASEPPKARTLPNDSSDAATNSTAAAVHAAADAARTAAPASDEGGAGTSQDAGDDAAGPQANEKHDGEEDRSAVATSVLAALTEILPALPRGAGAAASSAAGSANSSAGDDHGKDNDITRGLELAMAMADEHAAGVEDRIGAQADGDASSLNLDDIADEASGLSAKDLAALARARAASQSTSEAAGDRQADTTSTSNASALASFLKTAGATASSAGDSVRTTGTPAAVVSHGVSSSSAASFSALMSHASTTSAASASALPDSTAAQIVQTLRLVATGDGGEARITLDPNQFGQLSVSVRVEHGQVVARVEADQPIVREWLQSNQNQLRHQLAGQQLTLDRLEVREPSESEPSARERREHANGRASEEDQRRRRQRREGAGARFEVVA